MAIELPRVVTRRLGRGVRRALSILCLGGGLLATPAPLLAHLELRSSDPAAGAVLDTVPSALRLAFSQAVELAFSRVTLTGPGGAVEVGGPALAPGSDTTLVAPILAPLRPGRYTVRWQTASADGHPIRGEFTFAIEPGAAGVAAVAPGPAAPGPARPAHPAVDPGAFGAGSPPYVALRWLSFVALLGLTGAAAFRLLVLPRAWARSDRGAASAAAGRAAGIGLAMAVLLATTAVLRLYAQSRAVHGAGAALDAARIGAMLLRTVWGWGWLLQAVGVVLALTGFALARAGRRGGWAVAAAAAVLLAFTPALGGHAVAAGELAPLAVVADGLHVLGAGGWLGTLLMVAAVGIPLTLRAPEPGRPSLARLVGAFSPVALGFAALVVATGVLSSWVHLGSVAALWESGYGRLLLLKLGVLAGVFAAGAYNWLRVRPSLEAGEGEGRLGRSAALELVMAALVLAVTAALVATPPPADPSLTVDHSRWAAPPGGTAGGPG